MKVKIAIYVFALFICTQIAAAQKKVVNIDCNLSVNETAWTKDTHLKATMTLKNNSEQEVEISLPPHFTLEIPGGPTKESGIFFDEQYCSREKQADHIITKRTKWGFSYKIRQFFSFPLKSGESKTVKFHLTNLAWNDSMSSILIDRSWYDRIPSGNYNLYFEWGYSLDENDTSKGSLKILSNKIPVNLKSEK